MPSAKTNPVDRIALVSLRQEHTRAIYAAPNTPIAEPELRRMQAEIRKADADLDRGDKTP